MASDFTAISTSVPDHTHPLSDVTQLVAWQTSVERQLVDQDRALRTLQTGFIVFFALTVIFAITVLAVIG